MTAPTRNADGPGGNPTGPVVEIAYPDATLDEPAETTTVLDGE